MKIFNALIVLFASLSTVSPAQAEIRNCDHVSLRPFVEKKIREYISEKLTARHVSFDPLAIQVHSSEPGIFEAHVTTTRGSRIILSRTENTDGTRLPFRTPEIQEFRDGEGYVIRKECSTISMTDYWNDRLYLINTSIDNYLVSAEMGYFQVAVNMPLIQ